MEQETHQIFSYTCYRKFLSDFYNWHKKNTYGFSYRIMSEKLGFTSPNFMKLVIDGQRNIGRESIDKISKGFGLNKLETEYFSYLVFFSQAKDIIDKNYYYGLLASLRSRNVVSTILPVQCEYFDKWYYPLVRELVAGRQEPLNYHALSKEINAKITVPQIKKAVALLLKLGLIQLDSENNYVQINPLINTENEFHGYAIRNYHKQVLSIAQSALDEILPEQRENSHVTVKISNNGFLKLKKRIQDFRNELLQIVAEDTDVNNIFHLNIQLYPVTTSNEHDTKSE